MVFVCLNKTHYLCKDFYLNMIDIHFPDKTTKSYKKGITPYEIAQSISEGLARNILSAEFNGETVESNTPLFKSGNIVFQSSTS